MREEIITLLSNKSTLALNSDDIAKKLSINTLVHLCKIFGEHPAPLDGALAKSSL